MSLSSVYEKLKRIDSTPSTNAKIRLAKGYLQDETFKYVCQLALASAYVFHVKKFPEYTGDRTNTTNLTLFKHLELMNNSEGANAEMKETLYRLASMDAETYEVTRRICEGDLKCGLSTKNINKAIPGTIPYVPYMRCAGEGHLHRIVYPAYAQEKNDGSFANLICLPHGGIKFLTRNGKVIKQLNRLKRLLKPFLKAGTVYTGELLVIRAGTLLDRATGNGIITSCIYGTADQKDADCVVIRVWDSIPYADWCKGHCKTPYKERFSHVTKIAHTVKDPIFDTVLTQVVHNEEEARKFYTRIRANWGEGEVLKNFDGEWKDHTSPNQIKLINISEIEVRITGWNYGAKRSKYEHLCGAVLFESECRQIRGKTSGLTDEQRGWDWDAHDGDVMTLKFKELSFGKGKEFLALTHPRIDELRPDRRVSQTLEDLIQREGWEKDPAYLKYLEAKSK